MKTFIVFACLFVATVYGGCIQPRGYDPNICLFDLGVAFVNDSNTVISTTCFKTNVDVFSGEFSINTQKATCNAALVTDGDDCVRAYAKFRCSTHCARCGQKACKSLCADLNDACPTAVAQECFTAFACAISDSACTNWGVRLESDEASSSTMPTTTSAGSSFTEISLVVTGLIAAVFF